jgi:hypothetical protein
MFISKKNIKRVEFIWRGVLTMLALIGMIARFFCEKNANAAQAGGG